MLSVACKLFMLSVIMLYVIMPSVASYTNNQLLEILVS